MLVTPADRAYLPHSLRKAETPSESEAGLSGDPEPDRETIRTETEASQSNSCEYNRQHQRPAALVAQRATLVQAITSVFADENSKESRWITGKNHGTTRKKARDIYCFGSLMASRSGFLVFGQSQRQRQIFRGCGAAAGGFFKGGVGAVARVLRLLAVENLLDGEDLDSGPGGAVG